VAASTEKAIHVVGKSLLVVVVIGLCAVVGLGIYRINKLDELRIELIDTCDEITDAMTANKPKPIERENFLENIKSDWQKTSRPQPLRSGVFYRRGR